MLLSKRRVDYSRPLVQPGANANPLPRWTAARITGLGEFRAGAWLISAPVKSPRPEVFEQPTRPATAGEPISGDDEAGGGVDDGLTAFLAAIAAEVQGRAADACAALSAEFAGRMANVRMTAPKEQAAGLIAALKEAMRAAIKAVQEAAALEIKGRQKVALVLWRRRQARPSPLLREGILIPSES